MEATPLVVSKLESVCCCVQIVTEYDTMFDTINPLISETKAR
jgi:hypothetical protein